MRYRKRDTGEIVGARQIREERKGKSHIPEERLWDENTYDALGVDPILPSERPIADYRLFTVAQSYPEFKDGQWRDGWTIKTRPIGETRECVVSEVAAELDRRLSLLPSEPTMIRMQMAALSGIGFQGEGRVYSPKEALGLIAEYAGYREAAHANKKRLMGIVRQSKSPTSVDISAGWPE